MPPSPNNILVVDNGAYTIKAGFATKTPGPESCVEIPNCLARTRDKRVLVGAQLENCRDFGSMAFRRPVEKGYLVNWEAEKEIWDRTFLESDSKCDPKNTTLILTEAPNCPPTLQTNCDQMVFEEYEFGAYYRCVGPTLVPWNDIKLLYTSTSAPATPYQAPAEACLVIDSGFSHTHIAPVINGQLWNSGVRRIDIGGKFLTNYLKELVSLRTWNMMEEPYLINQVKESVCFVSTDFNADLEKCHSLKSANNPIVVDYVLPDYNSNKPGYRRAHVPRKGPAAGAIGRDDEQVMVLGNEMFTVPELLFSPMDVGLRQAGVAEVVMESLEAVPERYRPVLLANIVVVGNQDFYFEKIR
ncbi:Actin-related protein 6, partial [Rhizina undulata]